MTSAEVVSAADTGHLAGPELDLRFILRHKIVPEVCLDAHQVNWRRKTSTIAVVAGTREYDLPVDFAHAIEVSLDSVALPLNWIGEDPVKVVGAETASSNVPNGFYTTTPGPSGSGQGIALNCPPSASTTMRLRYLHDIWAEDAAEIDFSAILPRELHWTFVEGLRREIMRERFGVGDPRFEVAVQEFDNWKERVSEWREQGRGGDYVRSVL